MFGFGFGLGLGSGLGLRLGLGFDGCRKVTLCPASCRREPQFMSQSCAPPRMVRSLDAHDYSVGAHVFATRDA